MATISSFSLGDYQTNCHVVTDGEACWVVDCGYEPDPLIDHIQSNELHPQEILLTHCHADHIAGLDRLRAAIGDVPVRCHALEESWCGDPLLNLSGLGGMPVTVLPPTGTVSPGDVLSLGDSSWRVVHAPGHSPGSVLFIDDEGQQAIVGDTLFAGSIGRFDFPTSNHEDLRKTIFEVVMALPDGMTIWPGHGPTSTIGAERDTNPFVVGGF